MRQLLLNIAPEWRPTLDNFVMGRNLELLSVLRHALAGDTSEQCFFVWGEAGSGKSHLLQAFVSAAQEKRQSATYARGKVPEPASVVAVDDVECLDDVAQAEMFDVYNRMRDKGAILLFSGKEPPLHLKLRDDLRTRMGWGLVYQLNSLNDEEKTDALVKHAQARGFSLPPEVTNYLLCHGRRDLTSLVATLDALDEYSLRMHRAPSVMLLKEVLRHQPEFSTEEPAR